MLQGNFFTISSVGMENGSALAVLDLNPSHPIFEGHFPGHPVVPGVCMMQMVKEMLEHILGKETKMERADHMKFLRVINPEENSQVVMDLKFIIAENHKVHVMATLGLDGQVCFKFKGLFSC